LTWTKEDMHQQSGKNIIITGTNNDIGFETSLALAEKGAIVILAVPDLNKGKAVREKIISLVPNAKVDVMYLDFHDLSTIQDFVKEYKSKYHTLSILILQESIRTSKLQTTKEGFEAHFGMNYLGQFALTGLLLDLLKKTPNSRVITIGNKISNKTKLSFGYFKGSKDVKGEAFYNQSKLAMMLFAKHLDEKFKKHHLHTVSICCQPLTVSSMDDSKKRRSFVKIVGKKNEENKNEGISPILFAATEHSLTGGEYIGLPKNKNNSPIDLKTLDQLYDENVAHNLWQLSEKLCGITYRF